MRPKESARRSTSSSIPDRPARFVDGSVTRGKGVSRLPLLAWHLGRILPRVPAMIVRTGHRVPGVISWPAVVRGNRESWSTAITSDFLPTMMEVLGVERPESQRRWAIDGISQLPLLRGEELAPRCIGHIFDDGSNRAYRCGKWKLVNGTLSCKAPDCSGPMLCASSASHTRSDPPPLVLSDPAA